MYFEQKPLDFSWTKNVNEIKRVKAKGELDEWNKQIDDLKKNKRFNKKFEIENICENKNLKLIDNAFE